MIHVIDTFLGIPSLTIAGKMELDELMRLVAPFHAELSGLVWLVWLKLVTPLHVVLSGLVW